MSVHCSRQIDQNKMEKEKIVKLRGDHRVFGVIFSLEKGKICMAINIASNPNLYMYLDNSNLDVCL